MTAVGGVLRLCSFIVHPAVGSAYPSELRYISASSIYSDTNSERLGFIIGKGCEVCCGSFGTFRYSHLNLSLRILLSQRSNCSLRSTISVIAIIETRVKAIIIAEVNFKESARNIIEI